MEAGHQRKRQRAASPISAPKEPTSRCFPRTNSTTSHGDSTSGQEKLQDGKLQLNSSSQRGPSTSFNTGQLKSNPLHLELEFALPVPRHVFCRKGWIPRIPISQDSTALSHRSPAPHSRLHCRLHHAAIRNKPHQIAGQRLTCFRPQMHRQPGPGRAPHNSLLHFACSLRIKHQRRQLPRHIDFEALCYKNQTAPRGDHHRTSSVENTAPAIPAPAIRWRGWRRPVARLRPPEARVLSAQLVGIERGKGLRRGGTLPGPTDRRAKSTWCWPASAGVLALSRCPAQ